jgi:hypothetical protein
MDVFSTELGIWLNFFKTSEFWGGGGGKPPPQYATDLEGGSFTRNFETQMKDGSGNRQSVYGSSVRGTLSEGSFLGTLKNM